MNGWRKTTPAAKFTLTCPACHTPVEIRIRIKGIETEGLSLVGVDVDAELRHDDCPG